MYILDLINKFKSSNIPLEDLPIPNDFKKNNPNYFLQISETESSTNFLQILIKANITKEEFEKICDIYLQNIRKEIVKSIKEKDLSLFENIFSQFFTKTGLSSKLFQDVELEKLKIYFEKKSLLLKETGEILDLVEDKNFFLGAFKKFVFFKNFYSFENDDNLKLFSRALLLLEASRISHYDEKIKENMENCLLELNGLLQKETKENLLKTYSLIPNFLFIKLKNSRIPGSPEDNNYSVKTNQEKLNLIFESFLETIKSRADFEDCLLFFSYLNQNRIFEESLKEKDKIISELKKLEKNKVQEVFSNNNLFGYNNLSSNSKFTSNFFFDFLINEVGFSKKEIVNVLLNNFSNNKKEISFLNFMQAFSSIDFFKSKNKENEISLSELKEIKNSNEFKKFLLDFSEEKNTTLNFELLMNSWFPIEEETSFNNFNSIYFNKEILTPIIDVSIKSLLKKHSEKELSNIILKFFSEIISHNRFVNLNSTINQIEKNNPILDFEKNEQRYDDYSKMVEQVTNYEEFYFITIISELSDITKKNGFNIFLDGDEELVEKFNSSLIKHFGNQQITEKFILNTLSNNKTEKDKKYNNRF